MMFCSTYLYGASYCVVETRFSFHITDQYLIVLFEITQDEHIIDKDGIA